MRNDHKLAIAVGMSVFIALCVVCARDFKSVGSLIIGTPMTVLYEAALAYFGVKMWREMKVK